MPSLTLTQVRLLDSLDQLHDLTLDGSKIIGITPAQPETSLKNTLNAEGCIALPAFTNPHLHLCKVFTLDRMNEKAMQAYHQKNMVEAAQAIDLAAVVKKDYHQNWIRPNIERALNWALHYGNLHIRAFADVDNKAKLIGLECLLEAKERFADKLNLQVVAFAQDGIIREPGALELMNEAMQLGADVVGGIPWIEANPQSQQAHIDACYDLAEKYDRPVSMLVDDSSDPTLRTLSMMAQTSIKRGWQGRSLAHHARAMAMYKPDYLEMLLALLREAGVGLISDPHTGPLHAPVTTLLEQGNLVCLGQDDISDAYYPYGRNNMLEVGFLASHMLMMTSQQQQHQIINMITTYGAQAMNIPNYGLAVGDDANLVILNTNKITEALRFHEKPKYVIAQGKVLANS